MSFLDKLIEKFTANNPEPLHVDDSAIVAPVSGEMIDVAGLPDPMFAQQLLGASVAFRCEADKVIVCAPANGTIRALFPTGHAFGVETNEGVEILVHVGIDTVMAKGDGFRLFKKRTGDRVRAGDPIVEADIAKLSKRFDTSTILIITNPNGREISFIQPQKVKRGQSVIN